MLYSCWYIAFLNECKTSLHRVECLLTVFLTVLRLAEVEVVFVFVDPVFLCSFFAVAGSFDGLFAMRVIFDSDCPLG